MNRSKSTSEQLTRLRSDTRRRWLGFLASGILFIVALICAAVGLIYKGSGLPGGMTWLLFSVIGILAAALLTAANGRAAPALLPEAPDATAIGALMERLDISFGSERRAVTRLLADILEHVGEADSASFSRADRVRLNDALRVPDFRRNADLLVAIIRAYAVVGDREAHELIETLASQPGEIGGEQQVRDAARECLPLLEARIARLRTGADLLRASDHTPLPHELLRAAAPANDSTPTELLRAAVPATDPTPDDCAQSEAPATEPTPAGIHRSTTPANDTTPGNRSWSAMPVIDPTSDALLRAEAPVTNPVLQWPLQAETPAIENTPDDSPNEAAAATDPTPDGPLRTPGSPTDPAPDDRLQTTGPATDPDPRGLSRAPVRRIDSPSGDASAKSESVPRSTPKKDAPEIQEIPE